MHAIIMVVIAILSIAVLVAVLYGIERLLSRYEGNAFRQRILTKDPENIHLGNMGYHLALGDEVAASEELSKHIGMKMKKFFEELEAEEKEKLKSTQ